jgi:hypothetical protein
MTDVEAREARDPQGALVAARPDELVGRVAAALRARVEAQHRAEERLASFAFTETAPAGGRHDAGDRARDAAEPAGTDWLYFLLRSLRLLGEPDTVRLLRRLREGGRQLSDVAALAGSGRADRLAAADRVGELAAAGFVVRELESDVVVLAPLGAALLELVDEVERRAGEGGQA